MIISIIDLGTQSLKHYIFAVGDADKKLLYYKRYSESNLGEDENISTEAVSRNIDILEECMFANEKHLVEKTQILGTDILRKAFNAPMFLSQVKDTFGLDIKIVSHDDEARYLYEGFLPIIPKGLSFAAANIGGGSTELVIGDSNELTSYSKIPFGVKFLRKEFSADGVLNWSAIDMYLDEHILIHEQVATVFDTGVVIESLVAVGKDLGFQFNPETIPHHPVSLPMAGYDAFVTALQNMPVSELEKYYPKDPSYALNVALGHTVYRAIARKLAATKVILSENDLTDGVIYELLHQ